MATQILDTIEERRNTNFKYELHELCFFEGVVIIRKRRNIGSPIRDAISVDSGL